MQITAPPQRFIVSSADPSQREHLKADLLARDPGARVVHDLPIIDSFAVEVSDTAALRRLTATPGTLVRPDREIVVDPEPTEPPSATFGLDTATSVLGLDQVWHQGIRGQGVGIAVIDSGVADHRDFTDRIIGFKDFERHYDVPHDEFGHGTHVASIAAGSGKKSGSRYVGCAPQADIIGVRVMNENGRGTLSDIVAGIQWTITNKEKFHIRVMNLSIGGRADGYGKDDPLVQAVEAASAAGIVACVSAGNSGPNAETVSSPGIAPSAITVGALDTKGTVTRSDDEMAKFSSRGPTKWDGLTKPDVIAPGVKITAADAKSGGYIAHSGTSMASPMVAGCVALLLQARPDLTPAQVKELLTKTASPLPGLDANTQGAGLINVAKAITARLEPTPAPTEPAAAPTA